MVALGAEGVIHNTQEHPWAGGSSNGVLVVDDEELIGRLLRRALPQYGFQVWHARDGAEAIALCREHTQNISSVIMDVRMAGLTGVQTFAALQTIKPALRCCFTSGDLELQQDRSWLPRGALGFVAKPFALTDLVEVLLPPAEKRSCSPR